MSVVGLISPSPPCQAGCGHRAGSNFIELSRDPYDHTPADALRDGYLHPARISKRVYVCDQCLFEALETQFGDILQPN